MDIVERRKAARKFVEDWKNRGDEKQDTQNFWNQLLRTVYGVELPEQYIQYEKPVAKGFIDAYIPDTKVLIEQKGRDIDLDDKEPRQGKLVTPYEQARDYVAQLGLDEKPVFIVTCNFKTFRVYDCHIQPSYDRKNETWYAPYEEIKLEDLPSEFQRMGFLASKKDTNIKREIELSLKAGELVGKIHDRFLEQYNDPMAKKTQNSLNILCTRLVFCLYAEDAGLFGDTNAFIKYISKYEPADIRQALLNLFKVLDTPESERADLYLSEDLEAFPYCNGGLFENENIVIPRITQEIKDTLIESAEFNWSDISPTIFGAVFESTLNAETRRSGGMHYTSIENIHKVIDPLFLNDLRTELDDICSVKVPKTKVTKLKAFQDKLASLKFLDPACGSGNFLTETFISLRRLENKAIKELQGDQIVMGDAVNPIKVNIHQFYGFEINDFAVTVAKTALWIAESQMMKETEDIVHIQLDFLPLETNATIIECNALRIDWWRYVDRHSLSYIMGNPPFVGYGLQNKEQKEDMLSIIVDEKGKPYKTAGKIDYVSAWYFKAAQFIQGTNIRVAFVSTNSITQGEQVSSVWQPLYERFGIHIDFAHKTFIWDSEASLKAHVHVVIIGFSSFNNESSRIIYAGDTEKIANSISPYLIDAPIVFIVSRSKPICDVPKMVTGNRPADGGHLIIEADEIDNFLRKEPNAAKYIKRLTGSEEYINNKERYCLWLVGASPGELRTMPAVIERVEACRQDRLNVAPDRQKLALTPTLFRETNNPENYLLVPRVSSERRRYIPIGFLHADVIPTDSAVIISGVGLYEFGILESNVHMAWMRAVAGRLKSDYRYSKDIVYNNFPWPVATEEQRKMIEKTAQSILDARALYPDSSLADLYDPLTMPPELRKAHQENDKAVMATYGIKKGDPEYSSESACVAMLMKMYKKITE